MHIGSPCTRQDFMSLFKQRTVLLFYALSAIWPSMRSPAKNDKTFRSLTLQRITAVTLQKFRATTTKC